MASIDLSCFGIGKLSYFTIRRLFPYFYAFQMAVYLLLFLFTLKRRKEFSEGYETLLPVNAEDDAKQESMTIGTLNPATSERGRTFSDFINGFGNARQPSTARQYRSSMDGRDPDPDVTQAMEDEADEFTPLRSISVA